MVGAVTHVTSIVDEGSVVRRLRNGKRVGAVYRRHVSGIWYGQRRDEKTAKLHSWPTKALAVAWLEAEQVQ